MSMNFNKIQRYSSY